MAKGDYSKGDIVQLKSGGPKMTVSNPEAYMGTVECQWFSGSKLNEGRFPPDVLKPAEEEKPKK